MKAFYLLAVKACDVNFADTFLVTLGPYKINFGTLFRRCFVFKGIILESRKGFSKWALSRYIVRGT